MKKIFLLSLIFLCLTLWSQSGKSVIYLFGTNDVTIEETDLGQYKEYTLQHKVTSEDGNETPKKEVFTVYNNETPMFNERFIDAYYKLQASDTNIKKDTQAIFNEARVVYMRMRNEETNKALFDEYSFSPVAGILIVEDNVTIQQVNPRQQRLIKDLQKSRWKKLKKNKSVCFSVYNNIDSTCVTPPAKKKDSSVKRPANPDSTWRCVYINRFTKKDPERRDKYYKYTEYEPDTCTETQHRAGKIAFYYQKKRHVKKRILALIVDSIQARESLIISILQNNMLNMNNRIQKTKDCINILTNKIKTQTEDLRKKELEKNDLEDIRNGSISTLISDSIIDSLKRDFLVYDMEFKQLNILFDYIKFKNDNNVTNIIKLPIPFGQVKNCKLVS